MYAGHTPFPISIRNSAPAIAQLIRQTSMSVLLVSSDSAMQRLAHEAEGILAREDYAVQILPLPAFKDLYDGSEVGEFRRIPVTEDTPALILHSSGMLLSLAALTPGVQCIIGSTAHPKPIRLLHRNFSRWAFTPCKDIPSSFNCVYSCSIL